MQLSTSNCRWFQFSETFAAIRFSLKNSGLIFEYFKNQTETFHDGIEFIRRKTDKINGNDGTAEEYKHEKEMELNKTKMSYTQRNFNEYSVFPYNWQLIVRVRNM